MPYNAAKGIANHAMSPVNHALACSECPQGQTHNYTFCISSISI